MIVMAAEMRFLHVWAMQVWMLVVTVCKDYCLLLIVYHPFECVTNCISHTFYEQEVIRKSSWNGMYKSGVAGIVISIGSCDMLIIFMMCHHCDKSIWTNILCHIRTNSLLNDVLVVYYNLLYKYCTSWTFFLNLSYIGFHCCIHFLYF